MDIRNASPAGSGSGTVTSVGLTVPARQSVAGSPINTAGTLAVTDNAQNANLAFTGPASGAAAAPTFRALVAADLPAGTGTVTSVGMTVPARQTVTGSPVVGSGTLAITDNTQVAGIVFAGPATGGAVAPTFRALVGTDLPNPSAATKGGVESIAVVANEFLTGISTSGVPSQAQPATTNLSDYSTGAWTPIDASGAGLVFTSISCGFTRIGNMVFVYGSFVIPANASGANVLVGGLPFTVSNTTNPGIMGATSLASTSPRIFRPVANSTTMSYMENLTTGFTNTATATTIAFAGVYPIV